MTPAKLGEFRKAIGALLGAAVGIGAVLLSKGVLNGAVRQDVANVMTAITPLLTFFGAALPSNVPGTPTPLTPAEALAAITDARDLLAAVEGLMHAQAVAPVAQAVEVV